VRLYIACGNVIVNVDQQHNLPTQTQDKTNNVRVTLTLWCGYVTIAEE